MLNSHSLIATILLMLTSQSYAHEKLGHFTEEDLFSEIPQVISATHLPQKLTEAPASVTIIDRDMIKASSALKIADLLRLVPGMQVYDVHTNKTGVTYHGMSNDFPNQLEIMINGRSIYLPLLATVTWDTLGLSIHDIDFIEVVRGANTPTHGSNAFLGAINIITRSPLTDPASELRGTYGSLNSGHYSFRQSGSSSFTQFALAGGHISNDGIERFNDGGMLRYINLHSSMTPNLIDSIDIELGYSDGHASRGDGKDETSAEAGFVRRDHTANHQLIRWNRVLSEHSDITATYYHNYLNLIAPTYTDDELQTLLEDSLGSSLPPGTGTLTNMLNPLGIYKNGEHGRMDLHDLEILGIQQFSDDSKLAYGVGARYQRAQSEALFASADTWFDEMRWRLFGNWEYHAGDNWTYNTGAMFEHSNINGGAFSPRFAINYKLSQSSTLRAALTQAHRMPSLLDTYGSATITYPILGPDYIAIPNPDIDPEKNNSFEVGYFKIWPKHSTQLDVRFFYEDVTNAIGSYYVPNGGDADDNITRYQDNIASWINRGVEFQFKTKLPFIWNSHLVFNYGYNNPQGERDRGPGKPGQRHDSLNTRAPQHTASMLFSTQPTPSTLMGITHYYVAHTDWLGGSDRDTPDNSYNRTDLKVSKSINLDVEHDLEISLIVQNLFDNRYFEFYQYNDFDRRSYLQLKLSY